MRAGLVVLSFAGLLAAGCSDDDAQGGNTTTVTQPPTTSDMTVATTSPPPTTETPTTVAQTTSTPPTTTSPPTTAPVDEEALKAEIAADYERAFNRRYQMLENPRQRNLESTAARVFADSSPAFDDFVAVIEELVATGDRWVPNDPDLLSVTVENVELVGPLPYQRAIVTACEVTNRKQVVPAEHSPTGEEILVDGTGELLVLRLEEPVRRTANGWLRHRLVRDADRFEGVTSCPPD
jgi:hypothetical protein